MYKKINKYFIIHNINSKFIIFYYNLYLLFLYYNRMKVKKGGSNQIPEISNECLAIFKNPAEYGLDPQDYVNLNFEEFAKNKVGGGYKKKKS